MRLLVQCSHVEEPTTTTCSNHFSGSVEAQIRPHDCDLVWSPDNTHLLMINKGFLQRRYISFSLSDRNIYYDI